MGKKHKNGVKTLSLRLPQSVAVALQKRAKHAQRSINKQIVHELSYRPVVTLSEYRDFQDKIQFKEKIETV